MFHEFALEHAWLIPLLPAIAFVIIGMVIRPFGKLSAATAITRNVMHSMWLMSKRSLPISAKSALSPG